MVVGIILTKHCLMCQALSPASAGMPSEVERRCAVQALPPLPARKLAAAGALLVVAGITLTLALTGFDFGIIPAQISQACPSPGHLLTPA